jgi:hypothetical protein
MPLWGHIHRVKPGEENMSQAGVLRPPRFEAEGRKTPVWDIFSYVLITWIKFGQLSTLTASKRVHSRSVPVRNGMGQQWEMWKDSTTNQRTYYPIHNLPL